MTSPYAERATLEIIAWAIPVILTALGLLYRTELKAWRDARKAVREALQQIPQLVTDTRGMRGVLDKIAHQVHPNGGGSLVDAVNRTETKMVVIGRELGLIRDTQMATLDSNSDLGYFECAANGEITKVNETYARWMKCGRMDLMRFAFLNFVHLDDVEMVREELELSRHERREFRKRYRMVATDSTVMTLDVRLQPVPTTGEVMSWIGFLRLVRIEKVGTT